MLVASHTSPGSTWGSQAQRSQMASEDMAPVASRAASSPAEASVLWRLTPNPRPAVWAGSKQSRASPHGHQPHSAPLSAASLTQPRGPAMEAHRAGTAPGKLNRGIATPADAMSGWPGKPSALTSFRKGRSWP